MVQELCEFPLRLCLMPVFVLFLTRNSLVLLITINYENVISKCALSSVNLARTKFRHR